VGETSDEAKTFSTAQLTRSIFGDLHRERLKKVVAEREQIELENRVLRSEAVPKDELLELFTAVAAAMLNIIRSSKLSLEEQTDLRKLLSSIPIRVKQIATHQRPRRDAGRPGGGNGNRPDSQVRRQRGRPRKQKEAEAGQSAAVQGNG
jgi:hypothetical protein